MKIAIVFSPICIKLVNANTSAIIKNGRKTQ